jgi:hypothetical protein
MLKIKNRLIVVTLLSISTSCSVQKARYNVPQTIKMSHQEVMTIDYPTKKSVFIKFGTPTSKETYDNIENWYFKLSEITNTNSIGLASGSGRIMQDPMNPYLKPVDRSLVTNQRQSTIARSNSTTVETYVKFWFQNDSVTKWETLGVDYSRDIPNPDFNAELYRESQIMESRAPSGNAKLVFATLSVGMLIFLLALGG